MTNGDRPVPFPNPSGGASPASFDSSAPPQKLPLSTLNPNSSVPDSAKVPQTKICVFCGASPGKSPAHMAAARQLGEVMHANGIALVYGGGTSGIMGEVARTLVSLSGPESVHGIIPAPLIELERRPDSDTSGLPPYVAYGRTTVVKDMHTRKHLMASEVLAGGPGSGFVALSGGYGTLEELMEVVTWNQLGIHGRGVVVLNVEGYWDGLLQWVRGAVDAGFVGEGVSGIIQEARDGEGVVTALRDYTVAGGRFKLEWGEK